MKRNNLIKITVAGFFIVALLLLSNFAAAPGAFGDTGGVSQIGANLEYDDIDLSSISSAPGADSVSAFSLATTAESIELEDGTATGKLLFASESGFEGIYFDGADGIREYAGDAFTLNGVEYTIERTSTAYRISSTQSGSLAIGIRDSSTLILPDTGRNVKLAIGSREIPETVPATVMFNSRIGDVSASGERAAERASVSGDAPAASSDGCIDADEDEADPGTNASYVTVISSGTQSTVVDYCAVSGDVTRLYEAVCDGNTAKVEQVVCAEDKVCPEGEGACRERTVEAANKFCIDSDLITAFTADALIHSTTTKGTTIGYYAATTTDGGREFGAWSDYCGNIKTLIEYYCTTGSDQRGVFREVICQKGCSDGQCASPPFCYDSDGGAFNTVKGTIRGVNESGQYFTKEDSCKDANTVIEYRCTSPTNVLPAGYAANGFAVQEMPCGAGKHCNDGKCVSGEMLCNQCDPLNNFSIKQGTACNADGTPSAWALKRCPAGKYCSANTCIDEPKATMAQVTTAFEHRKKWAVLLNETLSWIETAKQIAPLTTVVTSGGYADTMEQIATGLSGTQTLLLRSQINLDVQADFGDSDLSGRRVPPI